MIRTDTAVLSAEEATRYTSTLDSLTSIVSRIGISRSALVLSIKRTERVLGLPRALIKLAIEALDSVDPELERASPRGIAVCKRLGGGSERSKQRVIVRCRRKV